jgi:hypothetical protein
VEERWELWVEGDLGAIIIGALTDFPGLKQIASIRRSVYCNGKLVSNEIRYHVTSASRRKLPPKKFLQGIRGHWQVENSLHHVKDRSWYEDKMYSKRPGQGWILGKLRNQALNIIRILAGNLGWKEESMPKRSARLQSRPKKTLNLLKAL